MRRDPVCCWAFSAPPTAIDGRFGLLEVFGGEGARPGLLAADLGKQWAVERVFVKVYPCCSWIQATVQQLVSLRGAAPLQAGEIRKITVGTLRSVRELGDLLRD